MSRFLILVSLLTFSLCFLAVVFANVLPTLPVSEPCAASDGQGIHLADTLGDACVLFEQAGKDNRTFQSIYCNKFTHTDLQRCFEDYSKRSCKFPVKLYLPNLKFNLDRQLFADIAEHIYTLVIKEWNPFSAEDKVMDFGSPFVDMKNLKLLDIAFDRTARFPVLPKQFLEGLDHLEALLFEDLPTGTIIEEGAFRVPARNLRCLGLLDFEIPCSCDPENTGHWLYHWLRHHEHVWGSPDRGIVAYTDKHTSEGNFFLCEAKLNCNIVETDSDKKEETKIVPLADYTRSWHKKCHNGPSTATPAEFEKENLVPRNGAPLIVAKARVLNPPTLRGEQVPSAEDVPFIEAVRSSTSFYSPTCFMIVFPLIHGFLL